MFAGWQTAALKAHRKPLLWPWPWGACSGKRQWPWPWPWPWGACWGSGLGPGVPAGQGVWRVWTVLESARRVWRVLEGLEGLEGFGGYTFWILGLIPVCSLELLFGFWLRTGFRGGLCTFTVEFIGPGILIRVNVFEFTKIPP